MNNKQIEKIDEQICQIKTKITDPHLCENTAAVYSRVSGYFRPVENWNNGKQAEFMERREYTLQ